MTVVQAAGVRKHLGGREIVRGLDLELGQGRAFALLGPNGAGKTTTVRLLTGLLQPDAGQVSLFGQPVTPQSADALRQRIGVQTDTNVYENLSVQDNLRLWGDFYGMSRTAANARIRALLDGFGLSQRAASLAGELSKGMRQKIAVARALLHEPELLFLDEPTAGLDPEASEELIGQLQELIAATGTTLILCTHQLHGLEALCQDVGILAGGRLVASGAVADLVAERWPGSALHLEVAREDSEAAAGVLEATPGVTSRASAADRGHFAVQSEDLATQDRLVASLAAAGVRVRGLHPQQYGMRDLYFAVLDEHRATQTEEVAR